MAPVAGSISVGTPASSSAASDLAGRGAQRVRAQDRAGGDVGGTAELERAQRPEGVEPELADPVGQRVAQPGGRRRVLGQRGEPGGTVGCHLPQGRVRETRGALADDGAHELDRLRDGRAIRHRACEEQLEGPEPQRVQQRSFEPVDRALGGGAERGVERAQVLHGAEREERRERALSRVEPGARGLAVEGAIRVGAAVERAPDDGVGHRACVAGYGRAPTGSSPRMPRAQADAGMRRPAGGLHLDELERAVRAAEQHASVVEGELARRQARRRSREPRAPDREGAARQSQTCAARRRERADAGMERLRGRPPGRARGRRARASRRRSARPPGAPSRACRRQPRRASARAAAPRARARADTRRRRSPRA